MPSLDTIQKLSLTAAQIEFWDAAQQLNPPSATSYAAEYVEIHGAILPNLFEQALRQVIQESDTLQVRFVNDFEKPLQFIDYTSRTWKLPFFDLSEEQKSREIAVTWMEKSVSQALDLSKAPLFTFALFKITDDCFFWYQGYPHIMIDGFGMMLIAKRVAAVYTALVSGTEPAKCRFSPLMNLVSEDAAYHCSEQLEMDRCYWLERFRDSPKTTTLASQQLMLSRDCLPDIRQTAYISSAETSSLYAVTKQALNVTLAQLITAAVATYIHHMTGTQDVILSVVTMGRMTSKERRVPGMTANMLPFRLKVLSTMSLYELCQQAFQEMLFLKRHQRYHGSQLHRELVSLNNAQGTFGTEVNVMCFDYNLRFSEHTATTHNISAGTTDDIMINVSDRHDGCGLRIDFDGSPQYYTLDDLDQHLKRFLVCLKVLVCHPFKSIASLDFDLVS